MEIRVRSSTEKGAYKVQTNGTLQDMLMRILLHEQVISSELEFNEFIARLLRESKTQLADKLIIKCGFPPKPLQFTNNDLAQSLSEFSIRNNETVIVEVDNDLLPISSPQKHEENKEDQP